MSAFIGPYRIVSHLGSGAFASVYRVHDAALHRTLALKILADNWSHNADIRRRFLQEARILAAIDHPHVVRVFTTATLPNGRPYFVMDDADRGTLAERLEQWRSSGTRPTPAQSLRISVAIAEGLHAVHTHGVIVRDLKPGNVLFRSVRATSASGTRAQPRDDERLLLSDFGVARLMDAATGATIVAGTPQYMAPEQADPQTAGAVDARVDLYAAAVILYELLTGSVPWPYASHAEILYAQSQASAPPDVSERLPDGVKLPDDLRAHLMSALQRDPVQRPATAEAWLTGLREALATLAGDDEADGPAAEAASPHAQQRFGTSTSAADEDATARAARAAQLTQRTPPVAHTADTDAPAAPVIDTGTQDTTTTRRQRRGHARRVALGVLGLLAAVALVVILGGTLRDEPSETPAAATPGSSATQPAALATAPSGTTASPATTPSANTPLTLGQVRAVSRFAAIDASCAPTAAASGDDIGQVRCERSGVVLYFISYPDLAMASTYAKYYRATFAPQESPWSAPDRQGSVLRFQDGESAVAYVTLAGEPYGIWAARTDGDAAALSGWLQPDALTQRPS